MYQLVQIYREKQIINIAAYNESTVNLFYYNVFDMALEKSVD